MVQVKLKINNKEVASTRKVRLEFPGFEANIFEKFSIFLYTKPSSIMLQIQIGSRFYNMT